jgi:hypothetical protein
MVLVNECQLPEALPSVKKSIVGIQPAAVDMYVILMVLIRERLIDCSPHGLLQI